MADTKLLKKNQRLLDISIASLIMAFGVSGYIVFLEMIVGVAYGDSWIGGIYLYLFLFCANMVAFAVCFVWSRRLMNSDAWRKTERAIHASGDADHAEKNMREVRAAQNAGMSAGAAAAAGGRLAAQAGKTSGNKQVQAAGKAAQAAGAAAAAGAALGGMFKMRKHTKQLLQEKISGPDIEKKSHTIRNIVLAELLIMTAAFIPGFLSVRSTYLTEQNTMQEAADSFASALEETGCYTSVRFSVYEVYATVSGYYDEEKDSYTLIELDVEGNCTEITYHIAVNPEEDLYTAAEGANTILAKMTQAAAQTPAAETTFFAEVSLTDEVLSELEESGYCKQEPEEGIDVSFLYASGSDTYFFIHLEED